MNKVKHFLGILAVFVTALSLGACKAKVTPKAILEGIDVECVSVVFEESQITKDAFKVTAKFDNGSTEEVTTFTSKPGLPYNLKGGKNSITISYFGIDKTVEVWYATYKTTDTPVVTDDVSNRGSDYKIVKFGDYPQTKVTGTKPELSPVVARNGWYVGEDGKYYGKAGDDVFSVEPILWSAITDGFDYDGHYETDESAACDNKAVLLLSDTILAAGVPYFTEAYSDKSLDIPSEKRSDPQAAAAYVKELDETVREIDGKDVYSNNYKYSTLRAYLNGISFPKVDGTADKAYEGAGFIGGAFSSEAQKLLKTVTVLNNPVSAEDVFAAKYKDGATGKAMGLLGERGLKNDCENTDDKVFVLSEYEATMARFGNYGNDPKALRVVPATEYAKALCSDLTKSTWLRTPYYKNSNSVRYIDPTGTTYLNTLTNDKTVGVVPAIVVDIDLE